MSSSSGVHLEYYLIPLHEINHATQNFTQERCIGRGRFGDVYRGQLSEGWQNREAAVKRLYHQREHEFRNELDLIPRFHHENIISFIGYCDEDNEMITVSEYAVNESLAQHLQDPDKMRLLTWADRLNICLGAARGLEYLHSGLGEYTRVIHRNVKSANILLDDNLVAKICDFHLSVLVEPNRPQAHVGVAGSRFYVDPVYKQSGTVNTELDVYSFGVVLFEMLSGMLAHNKKNMGDDDQRQYLINLVRRYYDEGLYNLIDPHIRDQINMRSFKVFKEIAYQCISWNLKDRPKMDMIIKRIGEALDLQNHLASSTVITPSLQEFENLENFLIPLEEIRLATRDFNSEVRIIDCYYFSVYGGQLSKQWKNRKVAFKRLNRDGYQGRQEFITQVKIMSCSGSHGSRIAPVRERVRSSRFA